MIPMYKLEKCTPPLGEMQLLSPDAGLHSLVGKSPGSMSAHTCPVGQLAFVQYTKCMNVLSGSDWSFPFIGYLLFLLCELLHLLPSLSLFS